MTYTSGPVISVKGRVHSAMDLEGGKDDLSIEDGNLVVFTNITFSVRNYGGKYTFSYLIGD